jgi:regulator of sigma E protease
VARAALEHHDLQLEFQPIQARSLQMVSLPLGTVDTHNADAQLFERVGLLGPYSPARIGSVLPGGAAARSQLLAGDVVLKVDQADIVDASQLRALIRESAATGDAAAQQWLVERGGAHLFLTVHPAREREGDHFIGRVGAGIGAPPAMTVVQYGLVDGISQALNHTWETSVLTLRVMGQIVVGKASLNNLSGPITIADYAGKSAAMGLTQFLLFLALMSISLGVLNLLPLPILDGGHLMYYLWEALSGKPVTLPWTERLQKVGLVILLAMMSVAIVNDVTRLLR